LNINPPVWAGIIFDGRHGRTGDIEMEKVSTTAPSFDEVWNNILLNEGNIFHTIRGLEFMYRINNDILIPSRTEYNIPKNDIRRAYYMLPLSGPGEINETIRGPSYVWAILNDDRICF
jgi:hypothetical protein